MKRRWLVLGLLVVGGGVAQVVGLSDKIQGYWGWTRVNVNKVNTAGAHPLNKDVYVNRTLEQLVSADGKYGVPFSAGTIFVKERTDPNTLIVTTLYTMEKTANGWTGGVFERKGDKLEGGNLDNPQMCVGCHTQAKDASDWVFTAFGKR